MAQDHISRIIADTRQFDAKITASMRVLQSLNQYILEVGKGNVQFSDTEKKVIKEMGNFEVSAKTTEGAVKQLNDMLRELTNTYNKLDAATKSSDIGRSMLSSINTLQGRLKSAQADLAAMGGASGGNGKTLFGSILGGNLAARAVMDSLRFLGNTLKDAVKVNMEFEQSNAELSAVLGKTKGEISDLTDQAKYLGATTLFTANEITNLQIALGRLGFNKGEIKASTEAVSQLALATGVELKDAATLTGSTLRAFGYRASEAARVASVLGVSTTKSALDMEKLKTAMGYASSVARQAGFEIEDVVAMLGKMVDNGQQATTAGVNMRNIMLDLSNKSSKLSLAIKQVTGKDQVRNFDEFVDALQQMREAGINLDDVANVVQKRVTPGFLNMIANTQGIRDLRDELKGCNGDLKDMADKMTNTLQGSITLLTSAWDGLMLSFSNSNGIIKDVVDDLTSLINKLREAREAGKEKPGVLDYEKPDNANVAREIYVDLLSQGKNYNQIMKIASSDKSNYQTQANIYNDLQKKYDDFFNKSDWGEEAAWKLANDIGNATGQNITRIFNELMDFNKRKDVGGWIGNQLKGYTDLAIQQDLIYNLAKEKKTLAEVKGDISGSKGVGAGKNTSTEKTPQERAQERVEDALTQYEIAIRRAALEKEVGYINEEQYTKKILQAEERLFNVYGEVASEIDNPEYRQNLENEAQRVKELAKSAAELAKAREDAAQAERDAAKAEKDAEKEAEALRKYNAKIVKRLSRYANRPGIGFEAVGLNNLDLTKAIDFQAIVDALNQFLAADSIKINLDLETGNIEEIKFSLSDALGQFDSKIGAFSTIINSVDNIKSSFESLSETINSDASVWDKWFAVFNFGIGVLQTVIGVLQAIETLKEANIMLSQAQTAANANEAASDLAVAGAASTEASANAAAAASGAGSAVAGIPIIGPMLAVAAIAAVVAAIASAFTKTEYHAQGGIAGDLFTPRGTDTIPAMLSPGELILNRSQQASIASQLQGQGYGAIQVYGTSRISGGDILIALDNTNRARGGSRGTYAYSK